MFGLLRHRLDHRGFITRPEILDAGHDDRSIAAWLRAGDLVRVGTGLYGDRRYLVMTPEQKHVLRCRAVMTRFGRRVVFTRQSAAVLHGLPVFGLPLDDLHVVRLDSGRARREADVRHHRTTIAPTEIVECGEVLATNVARTLWDIASTASLESSLVTIDAALHRGLVSDSELLGVMDGRGSWRGARQAKVALTLSDAAAESPLESRVRYVFHELGLPRPVSQFKVFGSDGVLIGIVDFAFLRERHLVEVDGLVKYASSIDLAREKGREDRIRAQRYGMSRIVESQLSPRLRAALADDLFTALDMSSQLYGDLAG